VKTWVSEVSGAHCTGENLDLCINLPWIAETVWLCPFPIGWLLNRGVEETPLTAGK